MPTSVRVRPQGPAERRRAPAARPDGPAPDRCAPPRPHAHTHADRRARLGRLLPPLALACLALVLTTRGISEGGFRYSDASRHAMDGVFVHDFLVDLPDSAPNPFEYALEYYAHYPSLGIGLYYPPFFAFVEAVFYALFGISAVTARLTVVAFGVLGAVVLYKLMRRIMGTPGAALAAGLFISLPVVVRLTRATMLEMPTTAMLLAAAYAFYRYVEDGHRRSAVWTGILVTLAVLTKQTAAFIVPAFAAYLLIRRRWRCLKQWQFWVGLAVIVVVLGAYFYASFYHPYRPRYLIRRVGGNSSALLRKLTRTWRGWTTTLTTPGVIALLSAGLACAVWELLRPGVKATWLLIFLLVAFFAQCAYVGGGGRRYLFLMLPILVSFVPLLLWRARLLTVRRALLPAGGAVLALAAYSYARPVQVMRGHADAGLELSNRAGASPFVLFDGHWDGDVVFFARMYDPSRHLVVLRGSKMLYAFASFPTPDAQVRVETEQDLLDFLKRYAIRVVAVEEKPTVDPDKSRRIADLQKLLRRTLKYRPEFRLAYSRKITAAAENTSLNGTRLLVYEVRNAPPEPQAKDLSIPLVGLGRSIRRRVDDQGRVSWELVPLYSRSTSRRAGKAKEEAAP